MDLAFAQQQTVRFASSAWSGGAPRARQGRGVANRFVKDQGGCEAKLENKDSCESP